MFPVASPRLQQTLRRPQDLAQHVLLHLEDPMGRLPWVDWPLWLAANGVPDLKVAGHLRFSQYDLLLQAAMDDQGVALGRSPLVDHWVRAGKLIAPFPKRYKAPRSYFAIRAPHAAARPEVTSFVDWVVAEAKRECDEGGDPGRSS